jgi:NADH-quinone oxidoreductase subunit G
MSEPTQPQPPKPGAAPPAPRPAATPPAATAPAGPALPPAGPDEVALVIDGRPVVVRKGTTVLQAAESTGLLIPHYCYHPGLSIAGNCRMCLVEIEKMPKLQIGCATVAAQGMIVKTTTDKVTTTRQGIMEFLLINHPLDCPICDQAGECRLQQYEAAYGAGYSRFQEEKVHSPKRYDIGRRVMFDAERCIKCTRCVRFCDEVSRSHELSLFARGDHAIIGTFPGKPLDNPYSGNTVDICPVGALTWKPFRFKARVWFLKNIPSVCAGCARGCNVNLATYRNRIQRMTPRLNKEVNAWWMCDPGRQSFEPLYDRPRLDRPQIRTASPPAMSLATASPATAPTRTPALLDAAIERAADLLLGVKTRHGERALAGLVSSRLTVEDLYTAGLVLSKALGVPRLAVPPHVEGEDDALLIRRDRTPNARGAALLGIGAPDASRVKEIVEDIAAGRVRGLVVVGEDPVGEGLLKEPALAALEALVVIDWWRSPTIEAAHVALPACGYGETEGVFVNFEGRAQRLRAALRPPAEAEPVWRVLARLGRRLGSAFEPASASAVLDEVAGRVPAFGGLSYRTLGGTGVMIGGA